MKNIHNRNRKRTFRVVKPIPSPFLLSFLTALRWDGRGPGQDKIGAVEVAAERDLVLPRQGTGLPIPPVASGGGDGLRFGVVVEGDISGECGGGGYPELGNTRSEFLCMMGWMGSFCAPKEGGYRMRAYKWRGGARKN